MLRLSWMRLGSSGPPRAHWIDESDNTATPSLLGVDGPGDRERAWRPSAWQVAVSCFALLLALSLIACSREDLQPAPSSKQLQAATQPDQSLQSKRDDRVQCQQLAAIPVALGPAESTTECS
jgi:hypothetical protein